VFKFSLGFDDTSVSGCPELGDGDTRRDILQILFVSSDKALCSI